MKTSPTPPPQTCGTCASWAQCADARMPDHGECAYREAGRYSHRTHNCHFTPSRWSVKK